jgi:hypothetical protein
MEIIEQPPTPPTPPTQQAKSSMLSSRNTYLGLVLIFAGLIWMLYNLNVVPYDVFHWIFSWQMLLVAIGGYLMSLRRWVVGGALATIGVVFLLTDMLDINLRIGELILPALVCILGLVILTQKK